MMDRVQNSVVMHTIFPNDWRRLPDITNDILRWTDILFRTITYHHNEYHTLIVNKEYPNKVICQSHYDSDTE